MPSRLSPKRSRVTAILFFNPGARLGWMIPPHTGRFIPRKNAVVSGWVSGGFVWVRNISPTLGFESRTVQLEARRYKYCTISTESEGVRVVKNSFHIRWGGLPTNRWIPIQTTFNAPAGTTDHRGLDLYGRPRSTAIAPSSWERTPGSHTPQGASCNTFRCTYRSDSCTVRAKWERELSLNTMALLVSKVVWRFCRSPNQYSSMVGISRYFNTEALQECGSGSDEDVTDGSATPTAARRVLCNRGSIRLCFNGMQTIWPLPNPDQSTNGFHLNNPHKQIY